MEEDLYGTCQCNPKLTGAQTRVMPTKSHRISTCGFDRGIGCGPRPMEKGPVHKPC